MICSRCGRERTREEFPLHEINPRAACVECLRDAGVLDDLALIVTTPEESEGVERMERLAAEGHRAGVEMNRERSSSVRELMARRKEMGAEEAEVWVAAWTAAGRPSSVEPWVYLATCRGAKYHAETQSIVEPRIG
jgi:hypothetical protein